MGDSATAPPPPDTTQYSDQASADASQMRDWAQSMWDSGQAEMAKIGEYAQGFMGMSLPAAEEMFNWASTQRDRFNEYVMPQMQSLFTEAELYASKGEEDRQRGAAIQDVKSATEAQRESQLRKLESYGVDPTDLRYEAMDKQAGVAEAALSALAANQAGERTKQIGRDLRTQAIDVGTGFLTDAQSSAVNAANIGGMGSNVGNAAANTGIALQQGALPYMTGAGASNATAAGIVDTEYGRELDYSEDQRAAEGSTSGLGALAGGLAGSIVPGIGTAIGSKIGGAIGGAEGGVVAVLPTGYATGGPVNGPGGPTDDAGAIRISDGEYIIPSDVVRKVGSNHFDKLIEKETGRPPPSMKTALPMGA